MLTIIRRCGEPMKLAAPMSVIPASCWRLRAVHRRRPR
ncbi:hypothetical protein I552_0040 [Mycobacterium xenopi 3993]|nr:hypothetical protein I552_0040 [Mycobacterium xenopi 3993]